MPIEVKTNLETLEQLYDELEDCGLEGILTGEPTQATGKELVKALIKERRLKKIVNLLAPDLKEITIESIVEVINSFLSSMTGSLQKLSLLPANQTPKQMTNL